MTLFCLPCPLSASTLIRAKCWWILTICYSAETQLTCAGPCPGLYGGYSQNAETSYLGDLKAFPDNLELETVLGFSGGGATDPLSQLLFGGFNSLPDPRGFSLRVRYSLSQLPNNPAFEPRPADERVGYFITAFRSPTRSRTNDPFVRYINRWHLEKRNPDAALSPPKEPIVFWIENAVPQEYRQAIWEGVEFWNQAFEQAGFQGAIEVRQMPDECRLGPLLMFATTSFVGLTHLFPGCWG